MLMRRWCVCMDMTRRVSRESPRDRFQAVDNPAGAVKFLWTVRMTKEWLEATDEGAVKAAG